MRLEQNKTLNGIHFSWSKILSYSAQCCIFNRIHLCPSISLKQRMIENGSFGRWLATDAICQLLGFISHKVLDLADLEIWNAARNTTSVPFNLQPRRPLCRQTETFERWSRKSCRIPQSQPCTEVGIISLDCWEQVWSQAPPHYGGLSWLQEEPADETSRGWHQFSGIAAIHSC